MKTMLLGLVAIVAAPIATAQESPLSLCTTLSFAPLDMNVPACTTLIEQPEGLSPAVLGEVYAARAEAYDFAITYHGDHDIDPRELMAAALADLEKAVSIMPASVGSPRILVIQRRADLRYRTGDRAGAIEDYRTVLAALPGHREALSGLEQLGAEQN
jgi:hypothetical protein